VQNAPVKYGYARVSTDGQSAAGAAAVPLPSQPAIEDTYSGKILMRMPKSLHAQIAKQAKKEDGNLECTIIPHVGKASMAA
jgi:hypothetical protein